MKHKSHSLFFCAACALAAFILWTVAVRFWDLQPIGPTGSIVGFATLNGYFHNLTGVHMDLYTITDWLSLVPVGFVLGFASLGLAQWIKGRSLSRVDRSILLLGGFYILVAALFVFFEILVINYRPILINGILEASYPSSTTMLVMCVMPTAILQLKARIHSKALKYCVLFLLFLFTIFMVIARLISGVHWLTDIVGGIFLSTGLVTLYTAFQYHLSCN